MENVKVHTPVANANTPAANVKVHTPVANANTPVANVKVHTPVANVKVHTPVANKDPSLGATFNLEISPDFNDPHS